MDDSPKVYLTARDLAKKFNVSVSQAYRLDIPRYQFGQTYRWHTEDVARYEMLCRVLPVIAADLKKSNTKPSTKRGGVERAVAKLMETVKETENG